MRKTSRELTAIVAAEKIATPGFVPEFKATAIGTDRSLRLVGSLDVGGTVYEVAADNGKIKTFSDVDGFLKFCAKCAEVGDGVYTVVVDTGALLASSVPSDIPTWAGNQITRLNKVKTSQLAVVAALDVQLGMMAGWATGNAAQQAKLAETQAQKATVNADIAAIDAEVVRLNALI